MEELWLQSGLLLQIGLFASRQVSQRLEVVVHPWGHSRPAPRTRGRAAPGPRPAPPCTQPYAADYAAPPPHRAEVVPMHPRLSRIVHPRGARVSCSENLGACRARSTPCADNPPTPLWAFPLRIDLGVDSGIHVRSRPAGGVQPQPASHVYALKSLP